METFKVKVLEAYREIEEIEDELRSIRRQEHAAKSRLREANSRYRRLIEEELHPERTPLLQHIETKEQGREGGSTPEPEGHSPEIFPDVAEKRGRRRLTHPSV